MTRFARAEGSKSSNKKLPEDGTPWRLLKEGISKTKENRKSTSERDNQDSNTDNFNDSLQYKGNTWSIIDEPTSSNNRLGVKRSIEVENSPSFKKHLTCLNSSRWILSGEGQTALGDLKEKLRNEGKDHLEIKRSMKNEMNKLSKKTKKKGNKRCLKCQKSDHIYKDCPDNSECDVCFLCGSTEHKLRDCKQKKNSQDKFLFATCFICKEKGHISSLCPDNPSGLYPYGGGCHECGEVTHFSRDCPKKQKQSSKKQFTLPTLSSFDIEGLPEDKPFSLEASKPRKAIKIVKF